MTPNGHDATEPDCDCVCGGRYHGRGSTGAREQIDRDVAEGRFDTDLADLARHVTDQPALF